MVAASRGEEGEVYVVVTIEEEVQCVLPLAAVTSTPDNSTPDCLA